MTIRNDGSHQLSDYQKMQQAAQARRVKPGGQAAVNAYVNSTPARQEAARQYAADPIKNAALRNPNTSQINALNSAYVSGYVRPNNAAQRAARTPTTTNTGTGRSGGGGGGGGGGAAAPPQFSQDQLNWMAELMKAGAPGTDYARLDLPEFQGQFDPTMYNNLRGALETGLQQSRDVGNQATGNLINFLNTNYTNAFNNPNNTYATAGQAPGMDAAAMARMLQGQGVAPTAVANQMQERMSQEAGLGSMWRALAANEDMQQRNRLTNANIMGTDVQNRINAAGLGLNTGIGMQEAQARSQYEQQMQERNWQTAQQEALQNWQRGNEVTQQSQEYRNAQIQALLGLLPELKGTTLQMPTAQSLGWV